MRSQNREIIYWEYVNIRITFEFTLLRLAAVNRENGSSATGCNDLLNYAASDSLLWGLIRGQPRQTSIGELTCKDWS
jgi:hypothetical protein